MSGSAAGAAFARAAACFILNISRFLREAPAHAAFDRLPDALPASVCVHPTCRAQCFAMAAEAGWFEVHSENYFVDGGPAMAALESIHSRYALSLHGVGLSLGSADPLDAAHLGALKRLASRFDPAAVSEHLCWSHVDGRHLNDLLPLPFTEEALALVCDRVDAVQDALQRPLLVENISAYARFADDIMSEWEFVAAVARNTGCKLLLDVNNIYVNAVNHGFDAATYIAAIPANAVAEIHLAGFDASGSPA